MPSPADPQRDPVAGEGDGPRHGHADLPVTESMPPVSRPTTAKLGAGMQALAVFVVRAVNSLLFVVGLVVAIAGLLAWLAFDAEAWGAELFAVAALFCVTSFLSGGQTGFLRRLYVGVDGRWSTSKLQVLLWTYVVVFAVAAILFADLLGIDGALDALTNGPGADDWDLYMILLGGPFAAAIAAKGLTSAKVDAGDITKPAEDPLVGGSATESLTTGVMQAVGNDSGSVDLVDFQYFLFNLLALTYFLGNFIPHVAQGFPTIPSVLVALTGTSAAGYVGKKAVEKSSPTIIAMQPAILTPGATIEVWGRWLVVKDAQGNLVPPSVSVGQTLIPAAQVPAGAVHGVTVKQSASSRGGQDRLEIVLPISLTPSPETTLRIVTSVGGCAEKTVTVLEG